MALFKYSLTVRVYSLRDRRNFKLGRDYRNNYAIGFYMTYIRFPPKLNIDTGSLQNYREGINGGYTNKYKEFPNYRHPV